MSIFLSVSLCHCIYVHLSSGKLDETRVDLSGRKSHNQGDKLGLLFVERIYLMEMKSKTAYKDTVYTGHPLAGGHVYMFPRSFTCARYCTFEVSLTTNVKGGIMR